MLHTCVHVRVHSPNGSQCIDASPEIDFLLEIAVQNATENQQREKKKKNENNENNAEIECALQRV